VSMPCNREVLLDLGHYGDTNVGRQLILLAFFPLVGGYHAP
jgi:hypothetical protein